MTRPQPAQGRGHVQGAAVGRAHVPGTGQTLSEGQVGTGTGSTGSSQAEECGLHLLQTTGASEGQPSRSVTAVCKEPHRGGLDGCLRPRRRPWPGQGWSTTEGRSLPGVNWGTWPLTQWEQERK